MTDEPMRPDPDRLLEQTAEAHRGKLKIFFGACAGVGKTFAMLTSPGNGLAESVTAEMSSIDQINSFVDEYRNLMRQASLSSSSLTN